MSNENLLVILGSPAAALVAAAMVALSYGRALKAQARRAILLSGTILLGVLLSLEHLPARRLSALLFLISIGLVFAVFRIASSRNRERNCRLGVAALLVLFLGLKWPWLQRTVYGALHIPGKYLLSLGAWLGASYVLFRLIHVLLESRRAGLPGTRFSDLLLYVLFPSTLIAGPIDRFPDFRRNEEYRRASFEEVAEGSRRIVVGIFKKFAVADFLGSLPLDLPHAALSTPRMWASLYVFGFQIFFDFAGYSDIAIGAARLVGFSIPENFDFPYLRQNITRFWQSWHMTLSGWMRDYVFFPLGRLVRRRAPGLPSGAAVFGCQAVTMVAIGLWHGLDAAFAAWGLWHGLGLFAHWKWTRVRRGSRTGPPRAAATAASVFVTFQFVMLGWVFFYGTSLRESGAILAKLFGR
ncbi:MAG: MBOAT family O-acyltransferase [Thermoanaerobaculia bacterium]